MNKTKIEWCDATWNPVTGCEHNCEYCYARKITNRFKGDSFVCEERKCICRFNGTKTGTVNEVFEPIEKWTKKGNIIIDPYPFGFVPTIYHYLLDKPRHLKNPRTIFVCSMSDLFGDWVPDEWIEKVFYACKRSPQHRYLFLTKNPHRYLELADNGKLPQSDNMWYGSTITGDNIQHFGSSGKYNTFLSIEPLLSPINMRVGGFRDAKWIIIGAETGNRRDKVVPQKDWVDHITSYCDDNKIPVFMKDSLIPIVGEENMRREFPWGKET